VAIKVSVEVGVGFIPIVSHVRIKGMHQLTNDELLIVKQCIKIIRSDKVPNYPGVRTTFDLGQAQHVEQELARLIAEHFGIKYDYYERFENV